MCTVDSIVLEMEQNDTEIEYVRKRERERGDFNLNQCDAFKWDNDCSVATMAVAQHPLLLPKRV